MGDLILDLTAYLYIDLTYTISHRRRLSAVWCLWMKAILHIGAFHDK